MSNLSVRRASEAAIGIATLRHYASVADESPRIDAMADEILGADSEGQSIRSTIHTLAARERDWIKERATHTTVSDRVNERREREMQSMVAVHAAALTALHATPALRTKDPEGLETLKESFVRAIKGIDEFPMGVHAKQGLREQLRSEAESAVPQANRAQVFELLGQAEQVYLKRLSESIYAHYIEPDDSPSPSF